MVRTLTIAQAKKFYDRFGSRQDRQDFYEAPAVAALLAHGDFAHAQSVFELGCGTGRLAQGLLRDTLPSTATYHAVDISSTMVALASEKLAAFAPRAAVTLYSGQSALPAPSQSADRFLATYVLDLLPEEEIRRVLAEAHRILGPGGLLCLAGITPGNTLASRIVMGLWSVLFGLAPSAVGGCRPIRATHNFTTAQWRVRHHRVIATLGIASEILVASRQ